MVAPLLILVMRVSPLIAVGTDLAYSVPTKLVGAITDPTGDPQRGDPACGRRSPADRRDAHRPAALLAFRRKRTATQENLPADVWTAARIVALGALVGFCVSLTSIGSGSISLSLLYLMLPAFSLRKLVGADVAFAALGHAQMGSINFSLAANLALGSVPGVIVGSKLCRYLPDLVLRPAIAGVRVFAATRLI